MGKQIRYTPEYNITTVQTYFQGNLSANQLALDLGIHPHTVRHWIQDYNDGKLKPDISLKNERPDFSNTTAHKQQEPSRRADIGTIIFKISDLESEMMELKALLKAYLLKW